MGTSSQFLNFSSQSLYLLCLSCFGPSPFTVHLRVFLLRSLHISLCKKLCGARVEEKSSPSTRTHQLRTRRVLRNTTVYRLQRSSSLWSGGKRSQGTAKAGTGITSTIAQKLFACCLHFPHKLAFLASLLPTSLLIWPVFQVFPKRFRLNTQLTSACFLYPSFFILHLFSHPRG